MTKGCLWQPITELHSSTRSGNLLLLSCCPASAECWAFLALVWPVVHNVSKATICCIAPFAASLWSAIPIPCETQPSCPIQALSYSTKVFSCISSLTGTMRRKPVSADGNSLEFPPPQCKALEYWPLEGGKMKRLNDLIELFGGRRMLSSVISQSLHTAWILHTHTCSCFSLFERFPWHSPTSSSSPFDSAIILTEKFRGL